MLSFCKKRRKKKQLRKFLTDLNRLLRRRYGRSRYYTKGQVEKTVAQEKIDRKFLWHGCQCFVDPIIANQVIRADQPINMEEVLSEIGEAFSLGGEEFSMEAIHDAVEEWQTSDSDSSLDSDFDGGFGDSGDAE